MTRLRLPAALLALSLAAAACTDDDAAESTTTSSTSTAPVPGANTTAPEPAEDQTAPGTIVEVAEGAGQFSTLLAAVEAAGLTDTLAGEGPFTVFAPTDEAFTAALESLGLTAEQLLADTAMLEQVLTYHVVPGEVPAAQVLELSGQQVETVNGASVTITVDGSTVMVDDATVIQPDVQASNGVIHVVDGVLLPPAA